LIPASDRVSTANPAVDGVGDVYTSLSPADPATAETHEIAAFRGGVARWRIKLDASLTPEAMATANGRLYINASYQKYSVPNSPGRLVVLDTASGATIRVMPLRSPGGPRLFAYKGGAITIEYNVVQYFTIDGVPSSNYAAPNGPGFTAGWTANADGRVFAETAPDPCNVTERFSLFAIDPGRGVIWNVPAPAKCAFWDLGNSLRLLASTSDGGVAVANVASGELIHVAANGTIDWRVPLKDYGWGREPIILNLHGTADGHVVYGQTILPSAQPCIDSCFAFELYDVNPAGSVTTVGRAEKYQPETRVYDSLSNAMALSAGHVYVSLVQEDRQSLSTTSYVYKFDTGLADEYPEVALRGKPAPVPSATPTPSPTLPPSAGNGLRITSKVVGVPLSGDPSEAAYVRVEVAVSKADGTPAVGARIKLSYSKAKSFVTNKQGVFNLVIPIKPGSASTASSATLGKQTVTTAQVLWQEDAEVVCQYDGRPDELGGRTDLIDYAIPGGGSLLLNRISEIIALGRVILTNVPKPVSTRATGYRIKIPGSQPFYSMTVVISRNERPISHYEPLYSRQEILKLPSGPSNCGVIA
jgi:hypothetical protein